MDNDWPLEQQVPWLIQLVALPPRVTQGRLERDEGWVAEDKSLINQVGGDEMRNPYHDKRSLALGGDVSALILMALACWMSCDASYLVLEFKSS